MGMASIRKISKILNIPAIFVLQQKIGNTFSTLRAHFAPELAAGGLSILDVGCGTGTCGANFIDMKRNAYTGVDIVPQYIDWASAHYPDGRYIAHDARSLPFPDHSFDIATFVGVLHHMDDQLAMDCLASVRRVLKPNGMLLVAEPIFSDGKPISSFFLRHDRGDFIRKAEDYERLLRDFQDIRQDRFPFSLHTFVSFRARPKQA